MKKILLIEDDKALSKMYEIKFSQAGYSVKAAFTGKQGLNLLKQSKPDLILLDIVLPRMDGFDLLKKIKKNRGTVDIPVVMLTNLDNSQDKELSFKLGALDYWVKARHTPEQIVAKLYNLLNG